MDVGEGAKVVAAFSVEDNDQIMLVTDGGKLIRCPLDDVSIKGRGSQGVSVLNVDENEKVVSVARLRDMGDEDDTDTDVEDPDQDDEGLEVDLSDADLENPNDGADPAQAGEPEKTEE